MKVSRIALVACAITVGAAAVSTPASAQRNRQSDQNAQNAPAAQSQPAYTLTDEERATLAPLFQAIEQQDWATAQTALTAAQAVAQGADAKYLTGQAQLRVGIQTQNVGMQSQGIDLMIASGAAPAEQIGSLLSNQAALAINANNFQKAEAALARIISMQPGNPDHLVQLAEVKNSLGKVSEAIPLFQQAIQARASAGQEVPENWYRRTLGIAYGARDVPASLASSRALVSAYPNQVNWRDTLLIYRDLANPDGQLNIDLMRLMRVVDALNGERDYIEFAEALSQAGLPGESKSVLEAGISKGMLQAGSSHTRELMDLANRRIPEDRAALQRAMAEAQAAADGRAARASADAYLGYGEFPPAIELYRLALQKGGVENDLVNTRLGIALALAGQRAEAEQAFQAVTGARRQLADLWITWLQTGAS